MYVDVNIEIGVGGGDCTRSPGNQRCSFRKVVRADALRARCLSCFPVSTAGPHLKCLCRESSQWVLRDRRWKTLKYPRAVGTLQCIKGSCIKLSMPKWVSVFSTKTRPFTLRDLINVSTMLESHLQHPLLCAGLHSQIDTNPSLVSSSAQFLLDIEC